MRVSAVLHQVQGGYAHWCPACQKHHIITTDAGSRVRWGFDGNLDRPTFSPSINCAWGRYADPTFAEESPDESGRCHYFIEDGQIRYCGDSTHELAGQTVQLPELPDKQRD